MKDTSNYNYNLSFFDLEKLDGWQEAWKKQDKKKVEEFLYTNGLAVEKGYEIVVCLHRTLCNKVEYGPRFEGVERTDPSWIRGGAASMEAHVAACTDSTLRAELLGKCRSGTSIEQTWVSELENEFKK